MLSRLEVTAVGSWASLRTAVSTCRAGAGAAGGPGCEHGGREESHGQPQAKHAPTAARQQQQWAAGAASHGDDPTRTNLHHVVGAVGGRQQRLELVGGQGLLQGGVTGGRQGSEGTVLQGCHGRQGGARLRPSELRRPAWRRAPRLVCHPAAWPFFPSRTTLAPPECHRVARDCLIEQ